MRLRQPKCPCAYCTFYDKLRKTPEAKVFVFTTFDEDMLVESAEETFLVMDERSSVRLELVPATYYN